MEDHLPKIPMMASASPARSSGSGTDDSRGKTGGATGGRGSLPFHAHLNCSFTV